MKKGLAVYDPHICDPDALIEQPDDQYGSLWVCPACGRTYA